MWNLIGYNEEGETKSSTSFWNMLGYEETEENNDEAQEGKKGKGVEPNEKTINENEGGNQVDDGNAEDTVKEMKKKKKIYIEKGDKQKKKNKSKKKGTETSGTVTPLLSDISSFADYCTSDDERIKEIKSDTSKHKRSNTVSFANKPHYKSAEQMSMEQYEENKYDDIPQVKISVYKSLKGLETDGISNNHGMETNKSAEGEEEETAELEGEGIGGEESSWFVSRIKNIIEPTISKEGLTEIIANNYNTFNQANAGIFDMFGSLLMSSSEPAKVACNNMDDANATKLEGPSDRLHYDFINGVINSINKEMAANIEMEALRMVKIYSASYKNFKNEIGYRDEVYQHILNEAEERATLLFDEKLKRNKRLLKMDFLILMNVNPDNYKSVIGSPNTATPKMKLEELFKITVD